MRKVVGGGGLRLNRSGHRHDTSQSAINRHIIQSLIVAKATALAACIVQQTATNVTAVTKLHVITFNRLVIYALYVLLS